MDCDRAVLLEADYLLERFEDELIVYHPTKASSLYLNDTGALIWQLCDGRTSIADIIAVLSERYPESKEQIEQDVKTVIRQLRDAGIATFVHAA